MKRLTEADLQRAAERAELDVHAWKRAGWSEADAREMVAIAAERRPDGTLPGVSVAHCDAPRVQPVTDADRSRLWRAIGVGLVLTVAGLACAAALGLAAGHAYELITGHPASAPTQGVAR